MTLDRLDTLIGIATIMLGLSIIIITIMNQMIASLLGHRRSAKPGISSLVQCPQNADQPAICDGAEANGEIVGPGKRS